MRWLAIVALSHGLLAEQLPARVFSARDGVATTPARIVVDSKGFVWIPSCDGLARFDGNQFRVFTIADGLPGNCTFDIFERRDGTYWLAAQDRLCLYDPAPGHTRFQCESPNIGAINTLVEDDRDLWCGTDTGLWRRPANRTTSAPFVRAIDAPLHPSSALVRRVLKDERGDVWAATFSGVYRFRSNGRVDRWTRADGLGTDLIMSLSATPGAIWAGSTQADLTRFSIDPGSGEARLADRYDRSRGLPSVHVFDVHSWRGTVWAATFQGLARQLPSGRWEAVGLDPSVSGFPVEKLATDALGNLWVGTDGAGVARVSGSGLSSFSERDGLALGKVWAIFEDQDGALMAVTKDEDRYFLNRFDGFRFHPIRPVIPHGTPSGWSWSQIAVHSRSRDWWLATGGGLLRYPRGLTQAPEIQGPDVGLRRGNIFRVFEESSGALWVSLQELSNNGLYRRDPATRRFESFDESHGLPSLRDQGTYLAAFTEDRHGQIWMGMIDRGLVRFRHGRFQRFPSSQAPDQGVRALLVDHQGRLWIGARRRGLMRVDDPGAADPEFFTYTKSNGLSTLSVLALAEDASGRIYAASGSGIDRLDPATGGIRHFTTADGLIPGELRVAFRDRQGMLWFGGDHGLVRLEPREEQTDAPSALVYSIRVNGDARPISDLGEVEPAALSLSSSERQVQVEFGGFRHDLLYQTRLTGVDLDWTPPSPSRSVHYLSLAPGRYELAIRAITPEGRASARPSRVRFDIAPPIWRRWWFLSIATAAGAILILAVHRYRLAQALAVERMRSRIAADLHDGVGASVSRIALLSEVVRRQAEAALPDAIPALASIADSARGVIDDVSDAVWMIDPQLDSLQQVVMRLRAVASELFDGQHVVWTVDAPEHLSHVPLAPEQRRHLYLIVKESLTNVLRHAKATRVAVRVSRSDAGLQFEITDDGVGVGSSATKRSSAGGHGLANMRTRASALGATLTVTPGADGRGTRVSLDMPLRWRVDRRPPA